MRPLPAALTELAPGWPAVLDLIVSRVEDGLVWDNAGNSFLNFLLPANKVVTNNAAATIAQLQDGLQQMQLRYPFLGEMALNPTHLTLTIGVPGRGPDPYLAALIHGECANQGLLLGLDPALPHQLQWHLTAVTSERVPSALDILEACFEELFET